MELKIKHFRKQKGFTVDKLSKKLNIGQSTLTNYENGNRDIGTETLCKVADILNVSVDELLGREINKTMIPIAREELDISENKKQLIEMVKELSEDDVLIATGIIARLNNKPVEEIFKKSTRRINE